MAKSTNNGGDAEIINLTSEETARRAAVKAFVWGYLDAELAAGRLGAAKLAVGSDIIPFPMRKEALS